MNTEDQPILEAFSRDRYGRPIHLGAFVQWTVSNSYLTGIVMSHTEKSLIVMRLDASMHTYVKAQHIPMHLRNPKLIKNSGTSQSFVVYPAVEFARKDIVTLIGHVNDDMLRMCQDTWDAMEQDIDGKKVTMTNFAHSAAMAYAESMKLQSVPIPPSYLERFFFPHIPDNTPGRGVFHNSPGRYPEEKYEKMIHWLK